MVGPGPRVPPLPVGSRIRVGEVPQVLLRVGEVRSGAGAYSDGETVDGNALDRWVDRARELCAASGRLAVCDVTIGELLAHAPHEMDGTWPCLPVREVIERVEGDELGRGLHCGIMNSRGTTSRSMTEGGAQERVLVRKYRQYAEACRTSSPRTAAVLRRVAHDYERQAKREDEEVEDRW